MLCGICSKLDMQRLAHPIYPCHNPLPDCSTPPTGLSLGDHLALGSIDEIKARRSMCEICKLVAETLDKEPSDLRGECRIREGAQFCTFKLPRNIVAQDPGITHFHLTQTSVIFDTSAANQFHGPSLPWELRDRDQLSSHIILNFQLKAKARSSAKAGESTGALSQTELEFLDTAGGRCVGPQANSQLIRAWLRQCEKLHGKACMLSSQRLPPGQSREPTFVIDVMQLCVVNTPSRCRYVALSYVWGTAPVFKHLLKNTNELRKKDSLRTSPLPATIRDAISLVASIGEQYLWVDSICIVQDNLRMQQTEIRQMGSIYSKALFTIVAAAGDHANSGLPGVGLGSREQMQRILKLPNCELLTVIDVPRSPSGIDETTWAQRGWTFQERVLSTRMLVFSENQVYWSCRAASHSEERALEDVHDIDRLRLSFPQQISKHLSWEPLHSSEYLLLYDDLLYGYLQRRLTYKTDILNAFDGVSEILSALQNDTFIWGLPQSFFSYAMTWSFTGYYNRNHVIVPMLKSDGSKEMIPFPSWSWAAWSERDINQRPAIHGGDGSHVRPVIHFSIVDENHQLVKIEERKGADRKHAVWMTGQPQQPHSQSHPRSRVGHLHFWTSFASLRAIQGWGPAGIHYALFPSSDFQPDSTHYRRELVQQDFIVIAARGSKLILLAIEWKDGIAYRVGKTDVSEDDWIKVENRQWRSIILG